MLRYLGLALYALGTATRLAGQGSPPKALDQFLRAQGDSGFAGVVLLATADSIRWQAAYGPQGRTPELNDPFWIASVTKSFTAAGILLLAHQGVLSLDDSLGSILPAVPADKGPITIRQLLTHTGGFGSTYSGGGLLRRADALDAILNQPLARVPGTGYQYEDDSYELLAALLELRTGRDWRAFLRQELLIPLGLYETGFWCDSGRTRVPSTQTRPCRDDWGHRGANGMSSTALDLLRWIRALARPPARWVPVLGPIVAPAIAVRDEGQLLVWSGLGSRVYTRGGEVTEVWLSGSGDDGHTCVIRALRSGEIVIVLARSGSHGPSTWSAFVAGRVLPRG